MPDFKPKLKYFYLKIAWIILCAAAASFFFEAIADIYLKSLSSRSPLKAGDISIGFEYYPYSSTAASDDLNAAQKTGRILWPFSLGFYITLHDEAGNNYGRQYFPQDRHSIIYIIMGVWLFFCLRPVDLFLNRGVSGSRNAARQNLNKIYLSAVRFFTIPAAVKIMENILLIWYYQRGAETIMADFSGIFARIFGAFYASCFTILSLENYVFSCVAPLVHESGDGRGRSLFADIKVRLFFNIVCLLFIPLVLILLLTFNQMITSEIVRRISAFLVVITLTYAFQYTRLIYRSIQAPLKELVSKMEKVASGDLTIRTSVMCDDEIGQLKSHFNSMVAGLAEREKIKQTFGKYVSPEIARKLLEESEINPDGETLSATVLFSDIRDFTSFSEKMEPAVLVRFLNEYFSYVTGPIFRNHGIVNKFIGDAVMAVFIPTLGSRSHADDAVLCAVSMRERLREFNSSRKGLPPVRAGIGIHTGTLTAGNIGTEERVEYTVIGDTVNAASRIEGETKNLGCDILVSRATMEAVSDAVRDGVVFESRGPVSVKGKNEALELFSVVKR